MATFRSIVFASVISGFIVGVVVTVLQQFGTVPLILKAEVFEKAGESHHISEPHQASESRQASPAAAGHDHAGHEHGAEAWEPKDGFERNAYTAAANVLTAVGFALLLAGFFSVQSGTTGESVSWHQGLMWGLAGFAVFTIAPGLGLPPELPGVPTAPLLSRQIWWVITALSTAAGLGLIFFRRSALAAIAGLVFIMLPHVIGAPELEHADTNVPSSLSHQFVVAVTLTSLVFWSMLGGLTSTIFAWFDRESLEQHRVHA